LSDIENNKRIVRERHQATQELCLGGVDHRRHMAGGERHFLAGSMPVHAATGVEWLKAWHSQTVSPTFHGLGPMIAQDDCVVEEWETFIHGADGALYNNQYCWIQRIDGDRVVEVREYEDSHHVWTLLGRNPLWPPLEPLTARRQSNLDGVEVSAEFSFDAALLRDPVPVDGGPRADGSGPNANRAFVRSLHAAQAAGDGPLVDGHYGTGFRHFMAGERPFGWEHLPLQDLYAPLVDHLASPLTMRFGPMVAEGDRVFEEMEAIAQLDDGTVYHNWHCFIHEFRDGKIVETREYLDTHHLWVSLGRWAAWADTPVPPLRKARRSNLPEVTATYQHRNPFLDLERWGGALV
jgi:ketosteroid isomerase-like protein